jgi:hypothetical protein
MKMNYHISNVKDFMVQHIHIKLSLINNHIVSQIMDKHKNYYSIKQIHYRI